MQHSSTSVDRFWDRVYRSTDYSRSLTLLRQRILADASTFFGPLAGKRMLEIGCGPGVVALHLARAGAHVTAIDLSAEAIAALRARCAAERITTIDARVWDAMAVDRLGRFDFVIGLMILHHIEPFADFAQRLHAALAPGGRGFFWENSARSPLLIWCRDHLVGRWWVPKLGDMHESPLTLAEIEQLRCHFRVRVEYPEFFFFRLIPQYLLGNRGRGLFEHLDRAAYRLPWLRGYSYRQYVMIERSAAGGSASPG